MQLDEKKDEARNRAVDALFEEMNRPGSPGMAIGIYQGGRSLLLKGYGNADLEHNVPITSQTVFHVASTSKQFTAFAIALLAREGKLDLDGDIRTYLPYVPDFGYLITVRHLIYHTSGLRDQWSLFDLGGHSINDRLRQGQIIAMVARQRGLNFEPGVEHLYSNTGYTLLAEIVRAVSGRTFRQFTTERIFQPLGMTRTFFHDDVTEVVPDMAHSYLKREEGGWSRSLLNYDNVGATSLFTTAEDMLKWAGNFARPVVGDAALIEQICTPGTLRDGSAINYAFALTHNTYAGHHAVEHSGADAGFRAKFTYFPAEDFAIAVLANHPPDDFFVNAIADMYLNETSVQRKDDVPAVIAPDGALLDGLAGSYIDDLAPLIVLERHDEGLLWKTPSGASNPIVFRDDGTFDLGDRWRTFMSYRAQQRDARGRVVTFENPLGPNYGLPKLYRRIEPVDPTPAALAELAGDYRSPELDITYTFAVENGRLTARSLWSWRTIVFAPSLEDRFDSDDSTMSIIEVIRDSQGRPTELRVHGGRTRHVLLERVPIPGFAH